jgi:hypothetical protein
MAGNKVVARFRDGRVIKGATTDFIPTRDNFHVQQEGGGQVVLVKHADLKAIFFVRDYAGNPAHRNKNEYDTSKPVIGRKIRVVFKDGEVIVGTTQGYQPGRPGFFVVPADPEANAERVYVLTSATRDVEMS